MHFKKLLLSFLILFSINLQAEEQALKLTLYGFVRNDFYYNSRLNTEAIDGLFNLFPKPIELVNGLDKNAVPQAEMLSIATRLGLDISGSPILGAKSSAKIEADFAGFSTNFYVLRIRHAYMKLNWTKSELLIGQTWHPLFGSVMPTGLSLNAGAPFQPFNRSPQIRFKYNLSPVSSLIAAASYQMQYPSQGPNISLAPNGANAIYLKNSLMPDMFAGSEFKTTHWTSGVGFDVKTLKLATESITSLAAVAYSQYVNPTFQLKAKVLVGQNMTDYIVPCGYGVSGTNAATGNSTYTNFNAVSSWLNAVYGKKWQVGLFLGYFQNLGTSKDLITNPTNKFTMYGYGVYDQVVMDNLYRIAPHISYNLPNFKLGLECDYTSAIYGDIQATGRISNPKSIANQRIVASVSYLF